ncbi:hypothetical protein NDU88_005416 [Pleurodeles waltl]|uniref:Uncharacterized protein n=1 Tax=Pleurodeles waltl TaxID=8319 RepID=A0AAV7VNG0_PLEWA|nr:hypothetical protein NDU88_005416 [Pleurodeles waltl]
MRFCRCPWGTREKKTGVRGLYVEPPGCQALKKVPPGHFRATMSVQLSPHAPGGVEEQHAHHIGCSCSRSRVKRWVLTSLRHRQDPFPLARGDSCLKRSAK